MKALIIIGSIIVAAVVLCIGSYMSAVNYSADMETRIEAEWQNNKQILGQYSLKIKEAAQIPSMQTDDLAKLFTGALGARYGADGSQAAMQWITEQNPNLDQSTYKQIQQMIEGGRNKFENAQSRLLDVKRQYNRALKSAWSGFWLRMAGRPTIDLDKYGVTTSSHAEKTFETGIEEEIKIR